MVQRNQDQHRIKFLEDALFGKKEETPEIKKVEKKANEEWKNPENQRPMRSNNNLTINNRSGKSILTAGGGNITDFGGPKKHMGNQTSNSIWDSSIIERLAETKGNKEKTQEEKFETERYKNTMKAERLDDMVKALQDTDTRKDATIASSAVSNKDPGYKAPSRNISIFDTTTDFERIPEQTHGEKVASDARKVKDKDESWKKVSKSYKTKDAVNKMFEGLFEKKSKKEKK